MADGGTPWYERAEARNVGNPGGLINSEVSGRTDQLPMTVAGHSHVVPADVVSGIGQGNTMAGGKILNELFKMGPYGSEVAPAGVRGHTIPAPPHMALQQTHGGVVGHNRGSTDVVVAGGEHVVPPAAVYRQGLLEAKKTGKHMRSHEQVMNLGHEVIDRMILKVREQVIKHMKKLPGPSK